jgi:alpha-beta hydrolase superfamily lysophospholipase
LAWVGGGLLAFWLLANAVAGWAILPRRYLHCRQPARTEAQRAEIRSRLCPPGCHWEASPVLGGEGRQLDVWRLCRPHPRGVAILLHGFGDDAWGSAPRIRDLPEFDVVTFTFRGRDRHPETVATLGGWEQLDTVAVVYDLAGRGTPRNRMLLVGASQGAGVALLALDRLEREGGGPLGGALLESPYESVAASTRNQVRRAVGRWEWTLRPAEFLALARVGHVAHFRPLAVSPREVAGRLRTPVAILAGDMDDVTPLGGIQAIASRQGELTVVPGCRHLEAGIRVPGGWNRWSEPYLQRWGFRHIPGEGPRAWAP